MTPRQAVRMFKRELAKFVRISPSMARTEFVLLNRSCTTKRCRFRDLAYAEPRIPRVTMLRRALRLPAGNVRGLILHELGHICDPHISRKGREQRADDIAEAVTGQRISYDRRDIQTTARGTYPRPRRLHR